MSFCLFLCVLSFWSRNLSVQQQVTKKNRMMKYQQDPPDSYKASYSCEFHACTKLHEMCTKLRIARRRNSCVFGSITSRVHEIARQYCDMWVISQAMCTKLHDIMSAPCRHGSHFLEIQSGQIVEFHAHEIARNRFWDIIEFHRNHCFSLFWLIMDRNPGFPGTSHFCLHFPRFFVFRRKKR